MHWLPPLPDFRERLRAACNKESAQERFQALAALSHYRLSFLETMLLDRALWAVPAPAREALPKARVALLASSTADHLLPGLRVAGLRRGMRLECYLGAFGRHRQELFDDGSPLASFAPQVVLLSLTAREAIANVRLSATRTEVNKIIGHAVAELGTLWRTARERFKASVIQQTFINFAEPLFGGSERQVPAAPMQLIRRLNDALADAAADQNIALLDIAAATERDGLDSWFDVRRWLEGKLEVAPRAAPAYGELAARVIAAQLGLSKKCLVLDLDNTLWQGIIGEDGVKGIVLGEGSASGEAHLALQRFAQRLRDRGVILAVCSKNDASIAEEAFVNHPEMALQRDEIACFVANWDPKPENLRRIAAKLNIGLDSLVFVDDNPAERAAVREVLPMVAVPELPADASQYVRCLADAGYFDTVAFTVDDQQRGEQYFANVLRNSELEIAGSTDDFLASLDMAILYGPVTDADLPRVTQLVNKTNQFNPTTRRYTLEEIAHFAKDPSHIALRFRLQDRFGDNGLVSVMMLRRDPAEPDIYAIDTWVMSCRVFGRQLELEAISIAVDIVRQRGGRLLRAHYIPSAKNAVVHDLYEQLGFRRRTDPSAPAAATSWELPLEQYRNRSTRIMRRLNEDERATAA